MKRGRTIRSSEINKQIHKTRKTLKEDETINVCSFYKGSGIGIVHNEGYFEKMDKIVFDKAKFQEINLRHLLT